MPAVSCRSLDPDGQTDPAYYGTINVFNEYFGRGLSSVVFQEIRESKSLAYSAYVNYSTAPEAGMADVVSSYIGTQPDKLAMAKETLDALLTEFPEINIQFENAKTAALKQIASGRITRTAIFFNYQKLLKLGIDYDIREEMYREIQSLTLPQLSEFFQKHIRPLGFNLGILGRRSDIDFKALEVDATVEELSTEQLFGF